MNPIEIQKELSAKPKLIFAVTGILVFVFVVLFFLVWSRNHRTIEDSINRRISAIPTILALANQKQIMENDFVNLQDSLSYIIEQISRTAEISYLYVLDARGVPMAEEFSPDVMKNEQNIIRKVIFKSPAEKSDDKEDKSDDVEKIWNNQKKIESVNAQKMYKTPHRQKINIEGNEIIDIFIPIDKFGTRWGAIRAGFSPSAKSNVRVTRNLYMVFMVFSLAISLVIALILGGHFSDTTIRIVDETEKDLTYRLQREFKRRLGQGEGSEAAADDRGNLPADAAQLSKEDFFTLLDIGKQLNATLKYDEILHLAVNSVVRLLKIRELTIFMMEDDQQTLAAKMGYNISGMIPEGDLEGISLLVGHGDIGVAAQFGTTSIIDEPKPGSAIVSALVTRGIVIGTIIVRNKISGKPFGSKDKLLVRQAVVIIANALENARLYEEARRV